MVSWSRLVMISMMKTVSRSLLLRLQSKSLQIQMSSNRNSINGLENIRRCPHHSLTQRITSFSLSTKKQKQLQQREAEHRDKQYYTRTITKETRVQRETE